MNCFNNLNKDTKIGIIIRSIYITILTLINIYCVIIISLELYQWITICILVGNCISLLFSYIHIWYMIHNNTPCTNEDECHCIGMFDFIGNVLIFIPSASFMIIFLMGNAKIINS